VAAGMMPMARVICSGINNGCGSAHMHTRIKRGHDGRG